MEWCRFYRENAGAISFTEHGRLITPALDTLDRQFRILNPGQRKVFVLGGFFPFNSTPQQFLDFTHKIHPNCNDVHILLDMNRVPLTSVDPQIFPNRIQARIEDMPFRSQTIDYLFMDNTIDFMDDKQVGDLSRSAAEVLTSHGLLLITKSGLILNPVEQIFQSLIHYDRTRVTSMGFGGIARYSRDPRKVISLMPELKLVYLDNDPFRMDLQTLLLMKSSTVLYSRDILVFSRPDTEFEPAMEELQAY